MLTQQRVCPWQSPEPAQDKSWECMVKSRVGDGRGERKIPCWTAYSSSTDPQNCTVRMTQKICRRIRKSTAGSILFCWRKLPFVVMASNNAMSPREEHQSTGDTTSMCSVNNRADSSSGGKNNTVGWL